MSSFILSSSLHSFSRFLIPLTHPPFVPFVIHLSLVCCLHTAPPPTPPYLQQGNVYSAPLLFAIILYHFLHPSFFCCFLLTSHLSHVGAHFSSPFCAPWLHFSKFVSTSIFPFSPPLLLKTFNIHHVIHPCVCWKEAKIWWKKLQMKHLREKRGKQEEESIGDVNIGDKEQRLIKRSTKE